MPEVIHEDRFREEFEGYREEWLDDAACADLAISDFFPQPGYEATIEAKMACNRCPVRTECVTHAYVRDLTTGYYGGMGPADRKETPFAVAIERAKLPVSIDSNRGRSPAREKDPTFSDVVTKYGAEYEDGMWFKRCPACKEEFPVTPEYWYMSADGEYLNQPLCRPCMKEHLKKFRPSRAKSSQQGEEQ